MNQNAKVRVIVSVWVAVVAVVLFAAIASASCASVVRPATVGGGAAAGAAAGSLGGPVVALVGAGVGGAVTYLYVESGQATERADKLENKILQSGGGAPPPSGPMGFLGIAWFWWAIAAYFLFLRRAHLLDLLTGKAPRLEAAMRAIGLKTHHSKPKE